MLAAVRTLIERDLSGNRNGRQDLNVRYSCAVIKTLVTGGLLDMNLSLLPVITLCDKAKKMREAWQSVI
jgi:hypothetical protein